MNWHRLTTNEVLKESGTSLQGLASAEVEQRLKENGPNQLEEKKKKPAWVIFVNQFNDFMIVMLAGAAIISGVIGDVTDTFIILFIVIVNAIVGFLQEYRAEKAMEALKKLASPSANVTRDNHQIAIPSVGLVVGDIISLEAGVIVPADVRLLETHSLKIDEASLTGESVSIDKISQPLKDIDPPLGDRVNMAYKGTQVANGRGKAVVVATGMNTEIGKIASLLQQKETMTPLQKRMADFGRKLSYLVLVICLLLFLVGLIQGEEPVKMLLVAISLAVAAIPEALPALITIALAKGAKRLVKKNVLIRKLHAVETLGSVTFICSDKTGTLTQNKMTVTEFVTAKTIKPEFLFTLMALNHDVTVSEGKLRGDPTEIALVNFAQEKGIDGSVIQKRYQREAELPFDSTRQLMTTVHKYEGRFLVITKGAVEAIKKNLEQSDDVILKEAGKLASNGMRVIAYAYKFVATIPLSLKMHEVENDLEFAGLAAMIDPPREEAKESIKECKTAGINIVMITGDHPDTAAAIAKDIGILSKGQLVMNGAELKKTGHEEWNANIDKIRVYARVSPEQKLGIVEALQANGHFVAMTGDGINDAPSLKKANIGVAMGITGTDVSKEAAHMILLDDNFATIVKAVREGRRIYDNIRRFVKYIMTCNSAEIWTIFLAPLLGLPIPLLPVHILWINLVTDGLPGLALSAEKEEANIMKRPPRSPDESLFADGIGIHIVWVGLLIAFLTLGLQAWAIQNKLTHWQTMVFTVLSLSQLAHAFAVRSDYEFIYKKGLFTNKALLFAVSGTFLLQLVVIYHPLANSLLKTQPLTLSELLACIMLSLFLFHAVEAEKWWKLRKGKLK